MPTVTATQVSRGFSDVLDAVEHGSTITGDGAPIAELRPVPTATGRVLGAAIDACDARARRRLRGRHRRHRRPADRW